MNATPASVVIVSRGRPAALRRCLLGVSQLQYDPFEVVVVADPAGIAEAQAMDFADALKLVPFDVPNISAARNLGVSNAAGEWIAFIDDDAVPEPTWLQYLLAPAIRPDVAATGGFVRGRNGISFQNKARQVGPNGIATPIDVHPREATILTPKAGRAIKTEGTNMAIRRDVLVKIGGFDEAFHFFFDETDLNMRLAQAQLKTAITPLAEVHHGYAASALRRHDRVPRDLFEIGASWAVYMRKHMQKREQARHWHHVVDHERRRLIGHMVAGRLEPRDVRRLMRRLEVGYAEGLSRSHGHSALPAHPVTALQRFPSTPRPSIVLAARLTGARKARQNAQAAVAAGKIVSLFLFSRTTFFHHVHFTDDGYWEHRGGQFGKSERTQKLFQPVGFRRRLAEEMRRLAIQRKLADPRE